MDKKGTGCGSAMTLIENSEKLKTEEACYKCLYQQKYRDGFACPYCGENHEPYYHIKTRKIQTCGKRATVLVCTVMEKTGLPLLKRFYVFWLVVNDKRGCSATFLSKELSIHYHNAWYLLKRIQTGIMRREEIYPLSGMVEVDESVVGASSEDTKPSKGTDKTEIILAVEIAVFTNKEGEGRLNPPQSKAELVSDTKSETVSKVVKHNVETGSAVKTDGFVSYQVIEKDGYTHVTEKIGKDENRLYPLWFHSIIANLKSFIQGTYHGLDEKHTRFYMSAFCWCYNRRGLNLFEHPVFSATNYPKIQYCVLTG